MTPAARREAAAYLQAAFAMSERQECRVIGVDRSSIPYQASKPDDAMLRERKRRERHALKAVDFCDRRIDGVSAG